MCLSLPIKILEFKNGKAIGNVGGKKEEFEISLVPDLEVNDYVLVSNGFAIKKVSEEEALRIFKIIKKNKKEKKRKEEQ